MTVLNWVEIKADTITRSIKNGAIFSWFGLLLIEKKKIGKENLHIEISLNTEWGYSPSFSLLSKGTGSKIGVVPQLKQHSFPNFDTPIE